MRVACQAVVVCAFVVFLGCFPAQESYGQEIGGVGLTTPLLAASGSASAGSSYTSGLPEFSVGLTQAFGGRISGTRLSAGGSVPIAPGWGLGGTFAYDRWSNKLLGTKKNTAATLGGALGGMLPLDSNSMLTGLAGGWATFRDTYTSSRRVYGLGGAHLVAGQDMAGLLLLASTRSSGDSDLGRVIGDEFSHLRLVGGWFHELYDGGPDLRLFAGISESPGETRARSFAAAVGLASRDGRWGAQYMVDRSLDYGVTHSVTGYATVAFDLERLFHGGNPFVNPTPVFNSPRAGTSPGDGQFTGYDAYRIFTYYLVGFAMCLDRLGEREKNVDDGSPTPSCAGERESCGEGRPCCDGLGCDDGQCWRFN